MIMEFGPFGPWESYWENMVNTIQEHENDDDVSPFIADRVKSTIIETASNTMEEYANSNNVRMHKMAARDVYTSPDTLRNLANDVDMEVRILVGLNENTPPDALAHLADDNEYKVRGAVAQNKNTPLLPEPYSETIEKLAKDDNNFVRERVADNKNVSPDFLTDLIDKNLNNNWYKICSNIAKNENTLPDDLKRLAGHERVEVCRAVALNINTPSDTLHNLLVEKEDEYIRRSVAINENTYPNDLRNLAKAKDVSEDILENIAQNISTPPDVLANLANKDSEYDRIRRLVASNEKAEPGTLAVLATHKNEYVRENVAENRSTDPNTLEILAGDDDYVIRKIVAENENTKPDTLARLANDKNENIYVRISAINNKNCPKIELDLSTIQETKDKIADQEEELANQEETIEGFDYKIRNAVTEYGDAMDQEFLNNKKNIEDAVHGRQSEIVNVQEDELSKEIASAKINCGLAEINLKTYDLELKGLFNQMARTADKDERENLTQVYDDLRIKNSNKVTEIDFMKGVIDKCEETSNKKGTYEIEKIKDITNYGIEKIKDITKDAVKMGSEAAVNISAGTRQHIENIQEHLSESTNIQEFKEFIHKEYEIEKNALKHEIEDYKKNEKEIEKKLEDLENKKETTKENGLFGSLKNGINNILGKGSQNGRDELSPDIEESIKTIKGQLLTVNGLILEKEKDLSLLMEQTINECTKGEYIDKDGNTIENTARDRFINISEELENVANEIREEQQNFNKDIESRESKTFDDEEYGDR